MRFGKLERVPDMVVWPGSHEHVERLVGPPSTPALRHVRFSQRGAGPGAAGQRA